MGLKLILINPSEPDIDPERAAYPQGPTRKLKADENNIFNGEKHGGLDPA